MAIQINSILTQVSEITSKCDHSNFSSTKDEIINFINNSKIKQIDKDTLLNKIKTINNVINLQQYIYNALLKYEGLGVNLK
jgi:hypothetical protein